LADAGGPRLGSTASGWETLREALYHEVHWAFYRNAPIVALGLYWGTWAGLMLAAFEALANPAWRKGLGAPERAAALLLRAALAVISSLLFLRTQNLWLAILLHWGVTSVLRSLYPAPSRLTPGSASIET
jgi:membrane protease YdiL (CAAX protease family)